MMAELNSKILEAVKEAAQEGKLSCAVAHHLADKLGVSLLTIGQAADELKIKINKCQLGCF